MEFTVTCRAITQQLTGRNKDINYVYTFVPAILFGHGYANLTKEIEIVCNDAAKYVVGQAYDLEIS